MKKLEIDKTRTTAFHPQSNAVCERMNRTLWSMLAKCVDDDQRNWSQQLPYVLMAYRASVHESTWIYPSLSGFWDGNSTAPWFNVSTASTRNSHQRQWLRVATSTRLPKSHMNLSAVTLLLLQQLRRNRLYNRNVHGPQKSWGWLRPLTLPCR